MLIAKINMSISQSVLNNSLVNISNKSSKYQSSDKQNTYSLGRRAFKKNIHISHEQNNLVNPLSKCVDNKCNYGMLVKVSVISNEL
jgi:hypothetical protein